MVTENKKKTNLEKKQTINIKLLKDKLIDCILNISLRKLCFFFVVSLLVVPVFCIFKYQDHPCKIKNPDELVSAAVEKVLAEGYESGAGLERRQVLQVLYDVFYGLRMENFKEPKDAEAIIQWAKMNGVLEGRRDGFFLSEPATKQESLVFLARSLGILDEIFVEKEAEFSNDTLFDEWTRPQLEGLVLENYLRASDIDALGDLRRPITVSELEKLLNRIVKIKTQYIGYWKFLWSWMTNNPFWVVFMQSPSIFTIIGFFIQISDKLKQYEREREKRAKKVGTIYLAGVSKTGKSTLKKQMKNPGFPRILARSQKAAKKPSEENIKLLSSEGTIILEGTIFDVPGCSMDEALRFFNESTGSNKILLLVLAHTKSNRSCGRDSNYIKEQRDIIKNFWMPIIEYYGKSLNKIVIFINKMDLLSPGDLPAQDKIFSSHIRLIGKAAEKEGVYISVAEGSATDSATLSELYRYLIPT